MKLIENIRTFLNFGLAVILLNSCYSVSARTFYVSTTGSDNNPGTYSMPWLTWSKAFNSVIAGDTVYFRGGVYYATVDQGNADGPIGTAEKPICFFNYPDEVPVLDGINKKTMDYGLGLSRARHVYLKGLTVRNHFQLQPGTDLAGFGFTFCSDIRIENCVAHHIGVRGFYFYTCDNIQVINCDSYQCVDTLTNGAHGDGYLVWDRHSPDYYQDTTSLIYFKGCRAWDCADDGWDAESEGTIILDNCWAFISDPDFKYGINGFKLGLAEIESENLGKRITNCLAAFEPNAGFTTNDDRCVAKWMELYNNISFRNDYGFFIEHTNSSNERELKRIFKNNVSFNNNTNLFLAGGVVYTHEYNSWEAPPGVTLTSADFISLDTTGITGPRKADGSLPDINFLKLAPGSDLIDAGTYVGLPFYGSAPDLGAFEYTDNNPDRKLVSSITLSGAGGINSITVKNGTLQIIATVLPVDATNKNVTWSVTNNTGQASISSGGLLTALSNGTVTVRASATDGSGVYGMLQIAISNQATTSVPVYQSSVIENSTPALLSMTYSVQLANVVPAASAFRVLVNNSTRQIKSVQISGSKVVLTLSDPVTSGDVVTVSYVKPDQNPLQSPEGNLVASLNPQTVKNNVSLANTPPVIVLNYNSVCYSGFVNEVDASRSYDDNKDELSYIWTVSDNVPVSSNSGESIRFLAPVINSPQTVNFTLRIGDGKVTRSQVIPVEIQPYQPDLEKAEILSVDASTFEGINSPVNVTDDNTGTLWAARGENQWIIIELDKLFNIQHVELSFKLDFKAESYFEILGSNDRLDWETLLNRSSSCDFSGNPQVFELPPARTIKDFKYVKLVGYGNSKDSWNYISEFRVFGHSNHNTSDYEKLPVKIYPNPASTYVTIRIDDPAIIPDLIEITGLTGRIFIRTETDPDTRIMTIPFNLNSGAYIIKLELGGSILFSHKLVVSN